MKTSVYSKIYMFLKYYALGTMYGLFSDAFFNTKFTINGILSQNAFYFVFGPAVVGAIAIVIAYVVFLFLDAKEGIKELNNIIQ
jgi:hypothetical protein